VHMPDVSSPEKLKDYCIRHEESDGVGILISGGSTKNGRVPLEPFLDTIRWVKDHTGLIINLHTGMLNKKEAEAIAATGIDIASVDLVGDSETLRRVYGIDTDIKEYDATLQNLVDGGVNVAPHICVGLDYGEIKGEHKALDLASTVKPETVVLISLIPTAGTRMENVEAPSVDSIIGLVREAVSVCKGSEISLGCMRSRGYKTELEWAAIEAGVTRIAMASRSTENRAVRAGYIVVKLDGCCATPRKFDSRLLRV
jgi:lipoyl synthase